MIQFEFQFNKAIQAMAYFARAIPGVEKVKMMKLLYLADKEHFLRHGFPITGDMQYAMPWGPVPSQSLNALDGEIWPDPDAAFEFLHVDDNHVMVKKDPGTGGLAASELRVLEEILAKYGARKWKAIVDETHELPEYKEVNIQGTSRRIPYEIILKHSGDPRHFRLNRPVISKEMREHMACPFPA